MIYINGKMMTNGRLPRYGAVIVETRWLPNLVEIINDHVKMLPVDWGLTIFTAKENLDFLGELYGHNNVIAIPDITSTADYNKLLTSKWFYEVLPYDEILIFQHDSMLLKKDIMRFVGKGYVGAPWKFQERGGNGGLSIRNVDDCIELLLVKDFDESIHGNEDIFFSNFLKRVAPRPVCEAFSMETIHKTGTTGYHAIDKYFSFAECEQIRTQYGVSAADIEYRHLCRTASDINQHLPLLKGLADFCQTVTEMGVRGVVSTFAFACSSARTIRSYDINQAPEDRLTIIENNQDDFKFYVDDVLKIDIEPTDLLFIDTLHTYSQLTAELNRHAKNVKKFIVLHDTTTFGFSDEPYEWQTDNIRDNYQVAEQKGLWPAVIQFTADNPDWDIIKKVEYNNGLTVLKRRY